MFKLRAEKLKHVMCRLTKVGQIRNTEQRSNVIVLMSSSRLLISSLKKTCVDTRCDVGFWFDLMIKAHGPKFSSMCIIVPTWLTPNLF